MTDRAPDRVAVPDLVSMPFRVGRDVASTAGVVRADPDPDGPPLGALAWPELPRQNTTARRSLSTATLVLTLGLAVTACTNGDHATEQRASPSAATGTPSATPTESIATVMVKKSATYEEAVQSTEQLMAVVERDCIPDVDANQAQGLRKTYELDMDLLQAETGPYRTGTSFFLSFERLVIDLCLDGQSPYAPSATP